MIAHTQPSAHDSVPQFIAREVAQPVPVPAPAAAPAGENQADAEAGEAPKARSLSQLVAQMDEGELDTQLKCLAGAIYFEARGEPLNGQLAVAEVIKNRASSGRFPGSYCGVVQQKSQFSFVKNGRMPAVAQNASWRTAQAIARIAHQELWQSSADGALYFHARRVSPGWKRVAVAQISSHIFYR